MTFDETLSAIRSQRVFVLATGELWPEQACTQDERQTLLTLLVMGDVRICPNPDLHRQYWRYAGGGCFQCCKCLELLSEVL